MKGCLLAKYGSYLLLQIMIKKLFYSVVTWISIVLCSCNGKTPDINQQSQGDTIERDIPLGKDGKPVIYYQRKDEIERKAGLNTIENGYNQLQIRLWYGYSFNDTSQLVILKNNKSNWIAELYTLKYKYNMSSDSILSITKEVVKRNPISGWQSFIESLTKLEILNLPDYHLMPEYYLYTDEGEVTVEIATPQKYRIYHYPSPVLRQDRIWQAKNMKQILILIENEYKFKRLGEL